MCLWSCFCSSCSHIWPTPLLVTLHIVCPHGCNTDARIASSHDNVGRERPEEKVKGFFAWFLIFQKSSKYLLWCPWTKTGHMSVQSPIPGSPREQDDVIATFLAAVKNYSDKSNLRKERLALAQGRRVRAKYLLLPQLGLVSVVLKQQKSSWDSDPEFLLGVRRSS